MPKAIRELAEAQGRTERRLEELAEAQGRTERRLEELVTTVAEAERRNDDRLENLDAVWKQMSGRMGNVEGALYERFFSAHRADATPAEPDVVVRGRGKEAGPTTTHGFSPGNS